MHKVQKIVSASPSVLVVRAGTGAALTVLIALDLALGSTSMLFMLFFLPVILVSWYDGKMFGLMYAAVCAVAFFIEMTMWWPEMAAVARAWNAFLLLAVLVTIAIGLDLVRRVHISSLRESESKYFRVVEAAIEGIVATDEHWRITFVNKRAATLFEDMPDTLRGRSLLELSFDTQARRALESQMAVAENSPGPIEVQLRKSNGGAFWALVTFTPTHAISGRQEGLVLMLTDISELKRSEEELNRRHREISAMQRLASGMSQSLDLDARLQNAVDTVLDVTGFDAGIIYLADETHSELYSRFQRGIQSQEFLQRANRWSVGRGVTGQVAATGIPYFIEDAVLNPMFDQQMRAYEDIHGFASIPLVSKEKVLGVMNILRRVPSTFSPGEQLMLQTLGKQIGISLENSYLYEMARHREQEIRKLSIDLVQVQEEERRRFARELHDGLSQVLTTLKINSELALKNCGSDNDSTQRYLKEVISLAAEAQTEAKQIAYDLRPAILDDFGLKAAINLHASNFERRTNVAVDLHLPNVDVRFGTLLETTIYRVVQELLTNVAKHARATRVTIQMLLRGNVLAVTVADNGQGFDVRRGLGPFTDRPHYGLRNVRERVEFLGGMFRAESIPGEGTEIMIELPIPDETMKVIHKREKV